MLKYLSELVRNERGQAFVLTLLMLVVGSLILVPSLEYVTTSAHTGKVIKENTGAVYAADAGIEDALWRIKDTPPSSEELPFTYTLQDADGNPMIINNMTVEVVIGQLPQVAGNDVNDLGPHDEWFSMEKTFIYEVDPADSNFWFYTVTLNMTYIHAADRAKILDIIWDFPFSLDYIAGTTAGDLTSNDPEETSTALALELEWIFEKNAPEVISPNSYLHIVTLRGPAGMTDPSGFTLIYTNRQDIAEVSEVEIFSITARAKDSNGEVKAAIKASGAVQGFAPYIRLRTWNIYRGEPTS